MLHITSLIILITTHINRSGMVSPFYSSGNWGSEGLNNGIWLPKELAELLLECVIPLKPSKK